MQQIATHNVLHRGSIYVLSMYTCTHIGNIHYNASVERISSKNCSSKSKKESENLKEFIRVNQLSIIEVRISVGLFEKY